MTTQRPEHKDGRDIAPPATLAGALGLAISDGWALAATRDDGRYRPISECWHEPCDEEGVCEFGAAGAVMARTLGWEPDDEVMPEACVRAWDRTLRAIDYMTTDDWALAGMSLYYTEQADFERRGVNEKLARRMGRAIGTVADRRFEGWSAYEGWLDFMEEKVIRALQREERAVYGRGEG